MVPEHWIPISVILRLRLSVEDMVEDMEIVNISLYVCNNHSIANNCDGSDSLNELMQTSSLASIEIANCYWHFVRHVTILGVT